MHEARQDDGMTSRDWDTQESRTADWVLVFVLTAVGLAVCAWAMLHVTGVFGV
jgi:hypothetical protein